MATAVESAFQVDVESTGPSIGVVVCAYTEDRWQDLELGVRELIAQVGDRDSVIVVIDNNPALLSRCQEHLAGPQVTVVANGGPQGLSGARNTGIGMCERDIVLFLDDDAEQSAIAAQFAKLLALARERGAAIAIGHPRPATLAVLAEEIPRAVAEGFEFVPVSYLLERSEELPE